MEQSGSLSIVNVENFTVKNPNEANEGRRFLDATNQGLTNFFLELFEVENAWDNITHLYLNRNRLKSIPENLFKQLTNLEWIDLRWNDLELFPTTVKFHPYLKTILLQDNNLTVLPIEFGSLERLSCLSVTNNPLERPGKNVLSKCKTNADLIDYFKRCWQLQTYDVPVEKPKARTVKRRRAAGKLFPVRRMKDHTEIICRLKNSGKIKDQIRAEKMQQVLENQQKAIQNFKDREVLKMWRDKYREGQGSYILSHYTPSFPGGSIANRITVDPDIMKYFTGDINAAISDLRSELSQIRIPPIADDPEQIIKTKELEMAAIQDIHKKVNYLKHRS
ncbi:Leucine Rich Repeat [Nesidiocoris tenuis]|uniref:Leucine Rich Repeat n=1 Tax=Nesidiocoris tenuis TaxID=355587 RepID=A0ABN7B2J2_9HEMI|nr:Leucine Rich Repeat [Nesidiocoris tenuis]